METVPLIGRPKPCPFCGGAAVISEHSGWFGVGCKTQSDGVMCNGNSHALQHRGEVSAVAQWNKRVKP